MKPALEEEVNLLKEVLGVALPSIYEQFLIRATRSHVGGWPILGLPLTSGLDSAWGATELVWRARPTLNKRIVALQFRATEAICLDLSDPSHPDPPVLGLSLVNDEPVRQVSEAFSEFVSGDDMADRLTRLAAQIAGLPADEGVAALADLLGLDIEADLQQVLCAPPPAGLEHLVYRIDADSSRPPSLIWALTAMRAGARQPPEHLIPIMPVDDRSFACVSCRCLSESRREDIGRVVRWHLDDVPPRAQQCLLDTSATEYIQSAAVELRARPSGMKRMEEIVAQYHKTHGSKDKLPRIHEERPIRLAVQNVIVGLAAIRHDSTHDGLAVRVWQSCQVPHVNAHEGCRGLASMTLAEAFRAGGTMEIRFDQHPERAVPASLRQYARAHGIALGQKDPKAISPDEARELFVAVAQMPVELAQRVSLLTGSGALSVERACFVLLSGVWRSIELDFILGTSSRAFSILRGGADPFDRPVRQAELGVCQAALMLGMLFARMSRTESDVGAVTRVLEDDRHSLHWSVLANEGAVRLYNLRAGPVPWQDSGDGVTVGQGQSIVVIPRSSVSSKEIAIAVDIGQRLNLPTVTIQPFGTPVGSVSHPSIGRLICPDGLAELNAAIESRLLACRVGRA